MFYHALWRIFLRLSPWEFPSVYYLLYYLPGDAQTIACRYIIDHYTDALQPVTDVADIPTLYSPLQDAIFHAIILACDNATRDYMGYGFYRQYLTHIADQPDTTRQYVHSLLRNLYDETIRRTSSRDGHQYVQIIADENGIKRENKTT